MERSVLHVSLASSLLVGVSALGIFIACDSSDSDDSGKHESAGASAGKSSGGAASGGTSSKGGASAQAGKSSTGGAPYEPNDTAGAPADHENGGTSAQGGTGSEPVGGDAGAGGEAACVPAPPELPSNVPAAIVAPAGVTLLRSLHAVGTQNYRCSVGAAPAPGGDPTWTWVLVEPVADLFNNCGVKVGSHFRVADSAPPVPEWKYEVDGSAVTGVKVDSAPVAGSIPELLLKENGHIGAGVFAAVAFVQRLHTVGGAAPPAASCDLAHVDETEKVPYTAQYYFYSGGN
jgi:Protein of unknown function (DUF3455)